VSGKPILDHRAWRMALAWQGRDEAQKVCATPTACGEIMRYETITAGNGLALALTTCESARSTHASRRPE